MLQNSRTHILRLRAHSIAPPRCSRENACPLRNEVTFGTLPRENCCAKEIRALTSGPEQNVDIIVKPEDFELSRSALDLFEDYLDGDASRTAQEVAWACVSLFSSVINEDFDEEDERRCAELIDRLDAQLDSDIANRAEKFHRAIIDDAVRHVAEETGTQFIVLETISTEYHDSAPVDIDVIDGLLLAANRDGEFIVRSRDVLFAKAVEALKVGLASAGVRTTAQLH